MLAAVWLMLSGLLYSLQLQTGSFPKPLTQEEEEHYLKLCAQGDLQARNILIERNLRLVAHIMKKYYAQTADQEDLISIGTIGLIKGIESFDASKGARLATYAARCVENATLSPATLRICRLHPMVLNNLRGAFWKEFRATCMSFLNRRTIKHGMRCCSYIVLYYAPHGRFWKPRSSIRGITAMRKSTMCRTSSVGADIAGGLRRQRWRILWA